MSVAIQYETLEEAEMRLRGTVIYYEGEPVFVYKVTAGNPLRVHFVPLPLVEYDPNVHGLVGDNIEAFRVDGRTNFVATEKSRKYISSKNFDYGVSKIGFVSLHSKDNQDVAPVWIGRDTQRQYRQGLTSRSCSICDGKEAFDGNRKYSQYSHLVGGKTIFEYLLTLQSFKDSLMGKNYLETVKYGPNTTFGVISRDFCWYKSKDFNMSWLYTNDFVKVGFAIGDDGFKVPKRFSYLSNALAEAHIPFSIMEN